MGLCWSESTLVGPQTSENEIALGKSKLTMGNPIPRNQAGKTEIPEGSKVFFYKPPGQAEVETSNRMAKHLDYYRGPATVTGLMPGRSRSYEIEYIDSKGKVTNYLSER